jgi:membrane protein
VIRDAGWHRTLGGVLRRTFDAAVEDNVPFLASALSFDLLLTVPPFALLVLGVIGNVVESRDIDVHALIASFLPSAGDFTGLENMMMDIVAHRGRLTAVGAVLFLWFSTRSFGGLRAALNEVFDTDENRSWPVGKLLDLGMVLATGVMVGTHAWLSVLGARVDAAVLGVAAWVWRLALQAATLAFSTALFLFVYKVAPSRRIGWRTALVAAAFTAVAFEIAKRLFALYVARFATFDRLASDANVVGFFLFLLWVYYTCYVFLLGGEVAETYDLVRLRRSQRVRLG